MGCYGINKCTQEGGEIAHEVYFPSECIVSCINPTVTWSSPIHFSTCGIAEVSGTLQLPCVFICNVHLHQTHNNDINATTYDCFIIYRVSCT